MRWACVALAAASLAPWERRRRSAMDEDPFQWAAAHADGRFQDRFGPAEEDEKPAPWRRAALDSKLGALHGTAAAGDAAAPPDAADRADEDGAAPQRALAQAEAEAAAPAEEHVSDAEAPQRAPAQAEAEAAAPAEERVSDAEAPQRALAQAEAEAAAPTKSRGPGLIDVLKLGSSALPCGLLAEAGLRVPLDESDHVDVTAGAYELRLQKCLAAGGDGPFGMRKETWRAKQGDQAVVVKFRFLAPKAYLDASSFDVQEARDALEDDADHECKMGHKLAARSGHFLDCVGSSELTIKEGVGVPFTIFPVAEGRNLWEDLQRSPSLPAPLDAASGVQLWADVSDAVDLAYAPRGGESVVLTDATTGNVFVRSGPNGPAFTIIDYDDAYVCCHGAAVSESCRACTAYDAAKTDYLKPVNLLMLLTKVPTQDVAKGKKFLPQMEAGIAGGTGLGWEPTRAEVDEVAQQLRPEFPRSATIRDIISRAASMLRADLLSRRLHA